jgi:hypothetical protein
MTIFVGSIPFEGFSRFQFLLPSSIYYFLFFNLITFLASEDEIYRYFEHCGNIVSIRLLMNASNRFKVNHLGSSSKKKKKNRIEIFLE